MNTVLDILHIISNSHTTTEWLLFLVVIALATLHFIPTQDTFTVVIVGYEHKELENLKWSVKEYNHHLKAGDFHDPSVYKPVYEVVRK